uniref:Chloride channel protein n=1 Tax=Globisporangium ultimum (strain ATCC 200006 / CBS 805.95 / DAOM BR144) TaxID=431595 RepID=K3XC75_GLOUD
MELQDELLPAHKRRVGRIGSLHEFTQRALSYHQHEEDGDEHNARPSSVAETDVVVLGAGSPPPPHLHIDMLLRRSSAASPVTDETDSEYHLFEQFRKPMLHSQRSRSVGSLFGGARPHPKSFAEFYGRQLKVLSFLVLLGVIGGPMGLGNLILTLRSHLVDLADSSVAQFVIWTAHTIAFSQLGLFITRLSPVAAGSGISQMKSILTGIDPRMYLPGYFDFATLLAKLGGLICSVGSGLVVGTEGAYVHIMSIVTHHLLQSSIYIDFCERQNARMQLLAAACAVGVSSTFSSPIGGVLFSMEVTSTYYLMSNYMKAFISSVVGALMLQLTLVLVGDSSRERSGMILETSFPPHSYAIWEIPLFMCLGAVVGVVATGTIWAVRVIAEKRSVLRKSTRTWKKLFVTWIDPITVAIVTGAMTFFPGSFVRNASLEELKILFTDTALPESWDNVSIFYSLAMVCIAQVVLLPLCITLRLPTGVWVPTFIAGAALGRFCGEAVSLWFPAFSIIPGTYALAGAAAFAGASTRTVSAAVITLEITGEMQLMLPIFCAVLSSMAVSNLWKEKSVYDTLLLVSGMPYLPLLDFGTGLTAGDIVEPHVVYITKRTTIARLLLAIQRLPNQDLPVLQNEATMVLLGVISGSQAKKFVRHYYEVNGLEDVEVDLGDAIKVNSTGFSWATIKDKLSWTRNGAGGLNGMRSVDQTYNALSTNLGNPFVGGGGNVPFLMDDEKMLALLNEGWSEPKRDKLNELIKITSGGVCSIRPMAMTISSATALDDLHMLFTMLRCDHCFVCDQGALVGVVTTKGLLDAGSYSSS